MRPERVSVGTAVACTECGDVFIRRRSGGECPGCGAEYPPVLSEGMTQ